MHTLSKLLVKYLMLLCILYTHCMWDNLLGNTVEQGFFAAKFFVESRSVVVLNFCKLILQVKWCGTQAWPYIPVNIVLTKQIMQKCVSVETTHASRSRVYCTGFIPLSSSCALSTHLLARTVAGWTEEDNACWFRSCPRGQLVNTAVLTCCGTS